MEIKEKCTERCAEGTRHLQAPEILNTVRYTEDVRATAGVKTQPSHCNIDWRPNVFITASSVNYTNEKRRRLYKFLPETQSLNLVADKLRRKEEVSITETSRKQIKIHDCISTQTNKHTQYGHILCEGYVPINLAQFTANFSIWINVNMVGSVLVTLIYQHRSAFLLLNLLLKHTINTLKKINLV